MRPKSDLTNDIIEANMKIEMKFLRHFSQLPLIHKFEVFEIKTKELYDDYYLDYIKINNITKIEMDYTKFCNRLTRLIKNKNILGINKPDVRTTHSKYLIDGTKLINWFITNNLLSSDANVFKEIKKNKNNTSINFIDEDDDDNEGERYI